MKKKLTEEELINWWLKKYHNTSLDKVKEDHPEWDFTSKEWNSRTFYKAYQCTKEQHNEWYEWAINTFMKHHKIESKQIAKRYFTFTYLNTAPMINENTRQN